MTKLITPKYMNYTPGSISFAEGFLGPRGDAGFTMKADYELARNILDNIIEFRGHVTSAVMGLDGDWRENSTEIYADGEHHEYNAYGGSSWAEPLMIVYFTDGYCEAYSVWRNENESKQIDA